MAHKCKVELYEQLDDEIYLNQIWNILKDNDEKFKPHLSKRDSVIDYELLVNEDRYDGESPYQFYEDLKTMSFILYTIDGDIKAFLVFKKDYILKSLSHIEFDENKSIYVAFSLVLEEFRNQGIFSIMNNLLEGYYYKKIEVIQRRVKSNNIPMINSLTRKNNYTIGRINKNERGEGVDTISLYKYLNN